MDLGAIRMISGLPILSGLIAGLFFYVLHRFVTTNCPGCGRRIPKSAITESGAHCPTCEGRASVPLPLSPGARSCHHCDEPLQGLDRITLWDNQDYCESCVAGACPELLGYLKTHDGLQETNPLSVWKFAQTFFLVLEFFIAIILGVALVTAFSEQDGWRALEAPVLLHLLSLPVVIVFTFISAVAMAKGRSTVAMRDGKLNVRRGDWSFLECNPTECEWFVGSQGHALPFSGGPAVLLVLPQPEGGKEHCVAVGFTEETRRIWQAFLTLTGAVRKSGREKTPQPGTLDLDLSSLYSRIVSFLQSSKGQVAANIATAAAVLFSITCVVVDGMGVFGTPAIPESLTVPMRRADQMIVYEGLPHQLFEANALERERREKPILELREFPFYRESLKLTDRDKRLLKHYLCSPWSYEPLGPPASCGGFHPDFAVEFRTGTETYQVLLCFGCGEVYTFGSGIKSENNLSERAKQELQRLLLPYHKHRPKFEVNWGPN
jgi:hypothetical protein